MKRLKDKGDLLFFISFCTFFLLPLTPLFAQDLELADIDLFAPVIRHEPPSQTITPESSLTLTAKITDNIGVNAVTLFYRTSGGEAFFSMKMDPTWKENYRATVPKESISSPGFEYYIQAGDQAGNTALRGFSFSPLIIAVSQAPAIAAEVSPISVSSPPQEPSALGTVKTYEYPWYKRWWKFWSHVFVLIKEFLTNPD